MWCWRNGIAFAATASVVAAIVSAGHWTPAAAESYRINNVEKAARIHMRATPSNRAKVVAYIPPDSRLEGTGRCDDKWCQVVFKDRTGWVFRKYLIPDDKTAAAMMLIGTLALTGFPGTAGYFSKDAIIEAAYMSHRPGATFAFMATVIAVLIGFGPTFYLKPFFNNPPVAKLYLTEFDNVWNASAPEHGLRSAKRG